MTDNALARTLATPTPQRERMDGRQVKNNAGGYVYETDRFQALTRFLILGTEGGTYYVGERAQTRGGIETVKACLEEDWDRTLAVIVDVSQAGRAIRNDQAIFALAMAGLFHADSNDTEHVNCRRAASRAIVRVCRTGTHLFQFMGFVKALQAARGRTGLPSLIQQGVNRYFTEKPTETLALHAVKYRQRGGWTYRDVLRLARPSGVTDSDRDAVLGFMAGRPAGETVDLLNWFQTVQATDQADTVVTGITKHGLPWEAVPDRFVNNPKVLAALLARMPYTATLRQLPRFERAGMLATLSDSTAVVAERLVNPEAVTRSRVHPMQILEAMTTHESGGRVGRSRGAMYSPNEQVLDALDFAFKHAFGNVEPTGKRFYLGVDVSPSMGQLIGGSSALTCAAAAAAQGIVTAAVETRSYIRGFSTSMYDLGWTGKSRVRDVVKTHHRWGRTDCALPMIDAIEKRLGVDVFVVITDNETWAGQVQVPQALAEYRQKFNPDARLAVIGMAATDFTIADPTDPGQMDIVGFDSQTPRLLSMFASGELG